ncbi:hypothetical protein RUM44_012217 [Polyplax serrata]|uniref:Uncharacterized protein n=1 Tax=Polyplax serrata TaxID=468196 RepID=A0ABR1BB17_POLSC
MSSSSLARMEPLDDVHMNAHECVAPVQVKEIEKPEDGNPSCCSSSCIGRSEKKESGEQVACTWEDDFGPSEAPRRDE